MRTVSSSPKKTSLNRQFIFMSALIVRLINSSVSFRDVRLYLGANHVFGWGFPRDVTGMFAVTLVPVPCSLLADIAKTEVAKH